MNANLLHPFEVFFLEGMVTVTAELLAVKSLMIKNYPVIIIKLWLSFIYFLPPLKYFSGFWKLFLTADNNWGYQFVLYKSLAMYN